MSLTAARASICNLGVNDVALPTNASVARGTGVGHLDHTITKARGSIYLPPVIANGDDFASISVSFSA